MEEVEEEYVLLDLDAVSDQLPICPNTPYVLSGLDTLNPILVIDDKWKLIGEYEETIGTCLIFSEEATPVVHKETGPSEANLFSGACIIDPNQAQTNQVKPITQLQKILKFKLLVDDDVQDAAVETETPTESPVTLFNHSYASNTVLCMFQQCGNFRSSGIIYLDIFM